MTAYDELVRLLTLPEYRDWRDGNPERSHVTALQHALQAATRAERAGAPDAEVIAALIHDAARPLSDVRHGQVVAEIMWGRLPDEYVNALARHGAYQRLVLKGITPSAGSAWARLGAYDAASFDPAYPSEPLEHFLPRLEAVMHG